MNHTLEIHFPRSDKDPSHWANMAFLHLLDENKKNDGDPVPVNGLEKLPGVIERLLKERRGLVVSGKEIRPLA